MSAIHSMDFRMICKRLKELKIRNLEDYYKTNHWQSLRAKYRGSNCYCCGCKFSLQLHHLSYRRLGKEQDRDIRVVCSGCHKGIHKYYESFKGIWRRSWLQHATEAYKTLKIIKCEENLLQYHLGG